MGGVRYVVMLACVCYNWHVALSVELECSVGVRELTSSIFYAQCVLLGYVLSALCLYNELEERV